MIVGIDVLVQDGRSWTRRAGIGVLHALGGALGGMGAGALTWLLLTAIRTLLPPVAVAGLLMAVAMVAIAVDARWLGPLPTRGQVPRTWWVRYSAARSYFQYGLMLGSVLFTFIPYGISYTVLFAAAMLPNLGMAMLAGSAMGLGRTVLVAARALAQPGSRDLTLVLHRGYRMVPAVSASLSAGYVVVLVALGPWS